MDAIRGKRPLLFLVLAALALGVVVVELLFESGFGMDFARDGPRARGAGRSALFALLSYLRASALLTAFDIIASFFLALVAAMSVAGKDPRRFSIGDYLATIFLPFRFIAPFFETLGDLFASMRPRSNEERSREIVRGTLMAIVALLVFSVLFASADPIFSRILDELFVFDVDETIFGKLLMGAFMTAFMIGAFAFSARRTHPDVAPSPIGTRTLGRIEATILFVAIDALFAFFVFIQFSYLFGGADHLMGSGMTYAQYAREGFFQLVVVAILSYLIVSVAESRIVRSGSGHDRSFKILSTVLVALVVAILVSAFIRLSLYESAYGWTTIRLYSHALMIWLVFASAFLASHVLQGGARHALATRLVASAFLLLLAMNALNPDAFIAKKNIERYLAGGGIDAWYLGSLSSDALPTTIGLIAMDDAKVHESFARSLHASKTLCVFSVCDEKHDDWRSAHFGDSHARALLAPYRAEIERVVATPPIMPDYSSGSLP